MRLWFSKFIKLSVAAESWVPVCISKIILPFKCNEVLVNSYTASKETMHAFRLTVIFIIASRNCAELSVEYGELAVKVLRKSCSHFARLWQD